MVIGVSTVNIFSFKKKFVKIINFFEYKENVVRRLYGSHIKNDF